MFNVQTSFTKSTLWTNIINVESNTIEIIKMNFNLPSFYTSRGFSQYIQVIWSFYSMSWNLKCMFFRVGFCGWCTLGKFVLFCFPCWYILSSKMQTGQGSGDQEEGEGGRQGGDHLQVWPPQAGVPGCS